MSTALFALPVLRETAPLHRYGKNGLILGFVFRIECKMPAYFLFTIKFKVRRNIAALVSSPRPGANSVSRKLPRRRRHSV
jgi:hypothetical protein